MGFLLNRSASVRNTVVSSSGPVGVMRVSTSRTTMLAIMITKTVVADQKLVVCVRKNYRETGKHTFWETWKFWKFEIVFAPANVEENTRKKKRGHRIMVICSVFSLRPVG